MAVSYRCDLCGKCYNAYSFLGFSKYGTKTISVNRKYTENTEGCACTESKCYDVCPNCYMKFLRFAKSLKKNGETDDR